MSTPPQKSSNWGSYRFGSSPRGSVGSLGDRSLAVESVNGSWTGDGEDGDETRALLGGMRRRRSSFTNRLTSLTQVGGVNSIENFTRSIRRAAAFAEAAPSRPALILSSEVEGYQEPSQWPRQDVEQGSTPGSHSLIRAHLEAYEARNAAAAAGQDAGEIESVQPPSLRAHDSRDRSDSEALRHQLSGHTKDRLASEILGAQALPPHVVGSLGGSYGTSYGTIYSTLGPSSMRHAAQIWEQQRQEGAAAQSNQIAIADTERGPLVVKEVEQDGKTVLVVAGQSTLPQTVFNSTNVLIGVGLLSLPLGIKYAGFLCGTIFLALSALLTAYTARILAKCMDVDASLVTFADLAFVSYGNKARIVTSILFTMELLAACVALVVLFADTLHVLVPSINVTMWKVISGVILIPLNFLPLRLLSFTSILGIFSCFSIVSIVFIDGFYKGESPGSLREPAAVYLFPQNWLTLPLSFGLLMSPWGGHSVFPNIYRDMRHPAKFPRSVAITFSFTYILDAATAAAGIIMFGDDVKDEITSNILESTGYPQWLSIAMIIFIAIIPLTKVPLNARPIVSTMEVMFGLDGRRAVDELDESEASTWWHTVSKGLIRAIVIVVFVIVAILVPAFDVIMAFMGSALCFTICIILPLLFYLKIFGDKVSPTERLWCQVLIVLCSIMATVGTVWAFLPKELIGAE